MFKEIRETIRRLYHWLGVAGVSLAMMGIFVIGSAIFYYASGIGEPPSVKLGLSVYENSIILTVHNGMVSAEDWEYLVFDERVNPPITWNPAPTAMRPGQNILLSSNLSPATYRVQIRHKPTLKFIFENKVTVGG